MVVVEFCDERGNPLDQTLFQDFRNFNERSNELRILRTDNPSDVGLYNIKYKTWYSDAPSNRKESPIFRVEIVDNDPCGSIDFFRASTVEPEMRMDEYTGSKQVFSVPDFQITPSACAVTYECTSVKFEGDFAVDRTMDCNDFDLSGKIAG